MNKLPTKIIIAATGVVAAAVGTVVFFRIRNIAVPPLPTPVEVSMPAAQEESYRDPDERFSFALLSGYEVASIDTETGESLVVDKKDISGQSPHFMFQIFILPFDEEGALTKERILRDVPDMTIRNPKDVVIDGAHAVVFEGKDDSIGQTIEVWFAHAGFLYQISAAQQYEKELSEVMAGWKFNTQ
ncbi:MAG: hypothetical protein Q8R30_03280 [bacterium]|nr:hypothetical protein [bacterium]